jgi:hypothetical protein
MGASVTANNAGAKLSSLAHRPEKEKTKDNRKRSSEELQQQDEGPHIYRKYVLAPRAAITRNLHLVPGLMLKEGRG